MDMKLELVLLPVSDVDVAKAFYIEQVGFDLDVDHQPSDDFRVVQMTPPGSACSVTVGIGLTAAEPGSYRGMHLVVTDIEAARAELTKRGVEVSEIRHMGSDGWTPGADPELTTNRSPTSATPMGTAWCCRRYGQASRRGDHREPVRCRVSPVGAASRHPGCCLAARPS